MPLMLINPANVCPLCRRGYHPRTEGRVTVQVYSPGGVAHQLSFCRPCAGEKSDPSGQKVDRYLKGFMKTHPGWSEERPRGNPATPSGPGDLTFNLDDLLPQKAMALAKIIKGYWRAGRISGEQFDSLASRLDQMGYAQRDARYLRAAAKMRGQSFHPSAPNWGDPGNPSPRPRRKSLVAQILEEKIPYGGTWERRGDIMEEMTQSAIAHGMSKSDAQAFADKMLFNYEQTLARRGIRYADGRLLTPELEELIPYLGGEEQRGRVMAGLGQLQGRALLRGVFKSQKLASHLVHRLLQEENIQFRIQHRPGKSWWEVWTGPSPHPKIDPHGQAIMDYMAERKRLGNPNASWHFRQQGMECKRAQLALGGKKYRMATYLAGRSAAHRWSQEAPEQGLLEAFQPIPPEMDRAGNPDSKPDDSLPEGQSLIYRGFVSTEHAFASISHLYGGMAPKYLAWIWVRDLDAVDGISREAERTGSDLSELDQWVRSRMAVRKQTVENYLTPLRRAQKLVQDHHWPAINPGPAWHREQARDYAGKLSADRAAGHGEGEEFCSGAVAAKSKALAMGGRAGNPHGRWNEREIGGDWFITATDDVLTHAQASGATQDSRGPYVGRVLGPYANREEAIEAAEVKNTQENDSRAGNPTPLAGFRKFHQAAPDRNRTVQVPDSWPRKLWMLGTLKLLRLSTGQALRGGTVAAATGNRIYLLNVPWAGRFPKGARAEQIEYVTPSCSTRAGPVWFHPFDRPPLVVEAAKGYLTLAGQGLKLTRRGIVG